MEEGSIRDVAARQDKLMQEADDLQITRPADPAHTDPV